MTQGLRTGQLRSDMVLENRYLILKTLGRGGMGAVYLALDQRLNNSAVAIKEMSTSAIGPGSLQSAINSFKQEASMLISLRHPALPRVLDFFPAGQDRWFFVMDYIEGVTLQEVLQQKGPLPESQVVPWARQIADILSYLHAQNPPVIFRDLKPSNIMLTHDGKIKLIDFGIARHFNPGSAADTAAFVSRGFAPPEQYGSNQTDPRADIYSLGATMHALLTGLDPGKNPFNFTPLGQLAQVSHQLENAVMKCLENQVAARPTSAEAFVRLLPDSGIIASPGPISSFPGMVSDSSPTAPLTTQGGAVTQPTHQLTTGMQPPYTATLPLQAVPGQVSFPGQPSAAVPADSAKSSTFKKAGIIGLILVFLIGGYAVMSSVNSKEKDKRSRYESFLQAGAEAFKKGDYAGAEAEYQQALALYQEPEAYIDMAKTYIGENKNEEALEYLTDLINQGRLEENVEASYAMGSACFNLGDYEQAINYFEKAVQGNELKAGSDYETANRDLAVSYARVGESDKAQEILDKLTAGNDSSSHVSHYVNGELALQQKDYSLAQSEFETAIGIDPQNARYKISLAELYLEQNKQESATSVKIANDQQAVKLLKEVQSEDKLNFIALNKLGQTCYELGQLYESQGDPRSQSMYEEGVIAFNQMADAGIADVDLLVNVGILQDKLGRISEAEKAYTKALQMDANSSRANLVYGLFKLKQKQYTAGYQYLAKTVQLNQNQAEVSVAQAKIDELQAKGWLDD